MPSYNHVVLVGHLTRAPEVRYAPSGTAVATFGLAINRRSGQGDTAREEVCYCDITTFGAQAEAVGESLHKGAPVLVVGRLRWQQWEHEGQRRSKLDVVAQQVQFLARREVTTSLPQAHAAGGEEEEDTDIPF